MNGCERCDFIGPELPSVVRDARELHRAMHDLVRVLIDPISDWQMRVLDRVMGSPIKRLPSIVLSRERRR